MDTCDKYNYLQKHSEKNIKNKEILYFWGAHVKMSNNKRIVEYKSSLVTK